MVTRRELLGSAVAVALVAPSAKASSNVIPETRDTDMTDPKAPFSAVQQYMDAFNKGDVKAMAALCFNPMSILDGMAPHVWHGRTATQDWYRDVLAEGEHLGAKGYRVDLGKPNHANVTGDAAYVVAPAAMSFTLKGKPVRQTGAVFTVALRKSAAGWLIASWAWAKGTASVE